VHLRAFVFVHVYAQVLGCVLMCGTQQQDDDEFEILCICVHLYLCMRTPKC